MQSVSSASVSSLCPFPTTITITPLAPPWIVAIKIINMDCHRSAMVNILDRNVVVSEFDLQLLRLLNNIEKGMKLFILLAVG